MCKEIDESDEKETTPKKKKTHKSSSKFNNQQARDRGVKNEKTDENSTETNPNGNNNSKSSRNKNTGDTGYSDGDYYSESNEIKGEAQKSKTPNDSQQFSQLHPNQSSDKNKNDKNEKKNDEESSTISYTPIAGYYSGSYTPINSDESGSYTHDY